MQDELNDRVYVEDELNRTRNSKRELAKLIVFRLPSIALADLILLHTDYIFNEVNNICSFMNINILAYILIQILARLLVMLMLLFCFLLLTLKLKFVFNLYKMLALITLPFVFTAANKFIKENSSTFMPTTLFVSLLHLLILASTVYLYSEIFTNIIYDRNSFTREQNQQVDYLNDEEIEHDIQTSLLKRRVYISFYTFSSFILNETSLFSFKSDKETINLISLGYLILLFYDLSANLDQMLTRMITNVRRLTRQVQNFGLNNILVYNWFDRLKIPQLFRSFFALQLAVFSLKYLLNYEYYVRLNHELNQQNTTDNFSIFDYFKSIFNLTDTSYLDKYTYLGNENYEFIQMLNESPNYVTVYIKFLVLNLSATCVSIAAVTSVISVQFYSLGQVVNRVTNIERANQTENELLNVGDVAAILFFLLSIQSGLSSLNGKHRIEKFCKNYTLLFIAILHYLHNNLDTKLMQLSASSKPKWNSEKHLRVVFVTSLLILIPISILKTMWTSYTLSTWLLAVSAFNIELIIKILVSLTVYGLIIAQSETDNQEEWVYYIRAFGHVMEFIVAIFLFFNGAYILIFESYGAIRAVMMCIHAYFHIFLQARKGWSVFMKRRTAMLKISRLPVFNRRNFNLSLKQNEQIDNDADDDDDEEYLKKCSEVCAICFSELRLQESRIMECNHLFHSSCLKRWLHVQSTCPMCQKNVN